MRIFITVVLSLFTFLQTFAQLSSTPCGAGPLPNACAPNTITLTSANTNSGVPNPGTVNGVGCNSVGSWMTAGTIYDYDVWYTTTVAANGTVSVYAAIVTGDPVVGIYSGPNCSTLTLRSCDDDGGSGLDALATASGLTPGSTVWIRVWDYNGGTGTYTTTATGGTPPANDNCVNAQTLTVNAAPVPGTGYCATVEASDWQDCENNTQGNVWYAFTSPNSGQHTVNITGISCFGSGTGVDVTIMTGGCGAFSSVVCRQAISSNSSINFAGVVGTTYYIMVDGDNVGGANSLCNFNIDVDVAAPVCGVVDFHAEQNFSPYNDINPFPSTMSCLDNWIYLSANDSIVAGNYVSPSLYFYFNSNADGNDYVNIYQGGTAAVGSGTLIFTNNVPNNTNYTVYGDHLSAVSYYVEVCQASNITWTVYDGNTNTVYGTGNVNNNGVCQRFGPFTPSGTATWTSNTPPGAMNLTTTNGVTYFDPQAAGPGAYNITYTWNSGGGCSGSSTRTITVTNPYSVTSLAYANACKSSGGNISPTITATAGGTYSSTPVGLSINSSTGVVNVAASTAGTYTVTYTVGNMVTGCGATGQATIIIAPDATINLTSAPGTNAQTFCIGGALTNITYAIGGTGTGANVVGLPAGVSGSFDAGTGVYTISGTPTATGVFNYTVTTTGPCANSSAVGTITVNPNNTVSPASSSPTVCINTAISPSITHTTTGATGIGVATGLPTGVTAGFAGNTITISGIPTVAGTFNYTIPLTGGCGSVNAIGTITVSPNNTVSVSSNPTTCINVAMTPITHTTTGATGIGAPSGLPTGVTAGFAGNTITISGTPSVAGTFNYTIPLTGGCGSVNATGTITVSPNNTVSVSSNPTTCINVAMTPITHTTTGATGIGAASGLPTGVTAGFAGNTITISGTPSVAGTFPYTIPLTGGCGSVNATGTITVNPNNTVSPASSSPTVCINTAISPSITHTTTGATGIGAASGLPTGVTAGFAGNTITISGTPSVAGTFPYTIPLTGGCGTVSATGTITVNPAPTIANSGAPQTICATTGSVTMAANTPVIGTGSWAQISGPVSGTITTPGSPTTTITGLTTPGAYVFQWSITNAPCTPSTSNVTITVNPAPTVANAGINQTICSSVGSATMAANTPVVGTGLWTQVSGPASTITTPSSPNTTITGLTTAGTYVFQWSIANSPCSPSTSTVSITVNANPTFAIGTLINPSGCGLSDGSITLTGLTPSTSYNIAYNDGSTVNLGTVTSTAGGTYVISGLDAGTYTTFVVTNSSGCSTTIAGPASLVDPSAPTGVAGSSFTNPTTCGGSDGTITISGLNPSSTYDITYSDGSSVINLNSVTTTAAGTYVITGLSAGSYSGFSLMTLGCTGSATGTVNLNDPTSPSFSLGSTNPLTCGAADGTITISGLLPSTTYTFSYDGPLGNVVVGNITTNAGGSYVLTNLTAGSYTNFVITASNLCSTTVTTVTTLTDPSAPVFTPGTSFSDPTTCNGTNGTITISGLNPNTTYDIAYNGPSGVVNLLGITTNASGSYVVSGLEAGSYNGFTAVLLGCNGSSSVTVTLTDPPVPTFSAGTTSTNPTTCGGSDGTITITGLTPSTIYDISYTGPSGVANLGLVTTDASGNYVITGLAAGSYFDFSVSITGCTTIDAVTVVNLTDPGAPIFTITGAGTNPTTCGGSDGTFSVTGLLPNTTYDFIYDNGSLVTISGTTDASGNYTVSGLIAGTYTNISVALAGCTSVNSTIITLTDPNAPVVTIVTTDLVCIGSTINLLPSSGGTWLSSDPSVATIDNTGLITGVSAGTATMTFTDASTGCSTSASSGLVTVNPNPVISLPAGGVVCEGSTINLTPSSGGTWSSNDPSIATIDNAGLVTGISAGTTNVVFTDATTTCSSLLSDGQISVDPRPIINVPSGGMVCEGSTINLTPSSGGTWSSSNPSVATIDNTGLVTGVSSGTSTVIFTDVATGCSSSQTSGLITVNPSPIVNVPSGGMVCEGSTINLTPSTGGTWSSSNPAVATIDNAGLVTGISSGTSTMIFTDVTTGCESNSASGLVTVNSSPSINVTSSGVVCVGSTINFTPSTGGTWVSSNPAVATIDNSGLVTGVSMGNANMVFTDAATGCSSDFASGLVVVGGVTASITATPTSGFIPLTVAFGNNSTSGVIYTWVFGDGTANSNQFEPSHTYTNLGDYTAVLIVSDGICFDTATVVIEVIGQSTILIPNVFTPNADGSNDVFTVDGTNLESVEATILNRWGQVLYEWNHVKGYWDGRTQSGEESPDGTYFYIIKAKGLDGVEYFKKGGFSLIR